MQQGLERRKEILYWLVTFLFLISWGRLILVAYRDWHRAADVHFTLACFLIVFPTPWLVMIRERQVKLLVLGCCSYVALGFGVSLLFR